MMSFFCIHISQGSVATCLKRGGIFKHELVANLLPSRVVKIFENRTIVSEVMAKSLVSCFFDSAFRKSWIFAITMELHGIFYLIQLKATLSLLKLPYN